MNGPDTVGSCTASIPTARSSAPPPP